MLLRRHHHHHRRRLFCYINYHAPCPPMDFFYPLRCYSYHHTCTVTVDQRAMPSIRKRPKLAFGEAAGAWAFTQAWPRRRCHHRLLILERHINIWTQIKCYYCSGLWQLIWRRSPSTCMQVVTAFWTSMHFFRFLLMNFHFDQKRSYSILMYRQTLHACSCLLGRWLSRFGDWI